MAERYFDESISCQSQFAYFDTRGKSRSIFPLKMTFSLFRRLDLREIVVKRENIVKGKNQNPENKLNYFVYDTQETLVTCLKKLSSTVI